MSLVNLYQDTDISNHKAILSYDTYKEDGFYGLQGVPFCIVDNTIYKAGVDSVSQGTNPPNTDYWEEFNGSGDGQVGTTSSVIVYVNSDTSIIEDDLNKHYVVNTNAGDVTITLPNSVSIDGTTLSVENRGSNILKIITNSPYTMDISSSTINIANGEYYKFSIDNTAKTWKTIMKEVQAVIGSVSHLVGFYDDSGELKVDIIPLINSIEYDINKYNLLFDNGNASWLIVSESVEVVIDNTTYVITIN